MMPKPRQQQHKKRNFKKKNHESKPKQTSVQDIFKDNIDIEKSP